MARGGGGLYLPEDIYQAKLVGDISGSDVGEDDDLLGQPQNGPGIV